MPKVDRPRSLSATMGLLAVLAAACSSAPSQPEDPISAAALAVEDAENAEAAQYAPTYLEDARASLEQARAVQSQDPDLARELAEQARADAEIAAERARARTAEQNLLDTEEGMEMSPAIEEQEGLTGQ